MMREQTNNYVNEGIQMFEPNDGNLEFNVDNANNPLQQQIRQTIRSCEFPSFNPAEMQRRLKEDYQKRYQKRLWKRWPYGVITLRFAAALTIIVVCFGFALSFLMLNPFTPIEHVSFKDSHSGLAQSVPMLWHSRLQLGRRVWVPKDIEAQLTLNDGSVINCTPNSQVSIQYGEIREIILNQGKLLIHAAPDVNRPMVVKTPEFTVHVKGTVFEVSVKR